MSPDAKDESAKKKKRRRRSAEDDEDEDEDDEDDDRLARVDARTLAASDAGQHAYPLVFEVHLAEPRMLLYTLPKVAERLGADDAATREATLTLLGRLFASPKEDYAAKSFRRADSSPSNRGDDCCDVDSPRRSRRRRGRDVGIVHGDRGGEMDSPRRQVAATPRPRRGSSVEIAAKRIVCEDKSRRRRGRDVDRPRRSRRNG